MTSATLTKRRLARAVRPLRWVAAVVLALLLLPYLVVPFYRFVDPVSTLMVWRRLTGARVVRQVTPLSRMAEVLPRTVIAAEDGHFCFHHGIDWGSLRDAYEEADDFSDMRGGSTITQQIAKNLFLWPGRNVLRKALELPLALWIDLVLPKRRVLEIYLNVVQWGPNGEFGAEAASRYAFGKSVRRITAREAALLAAILPNPLRRSARTPAPVVRRLARIHQARAAHAVTSCIAP
jgi:monofunctional glycosyltransferase